MVVWIVFSESEHEERDTTDRPCNMVLDTSLALWIIFHDDRFSGRVWSNAERMKRAHDTLARVLQSNIHTYTLRMTETHTYMHTDRTHWALLVGLKIMICGSDSRLFWTRHLIYSHVFIPTQAKKWLAVIVDCITTVMMRMIM
jgi:hypothetical protein